MGIISDTACQHAPAFGLRLSALQHAQPFGLRSSACQQEQKAEVLTRRQRRRADERRRQPECADMLAKRSKSAFTTISSASRRRWKPSSLEICCMAWLSKRI